MALVNDLYFAMKNGFNIRFFYSGTDGDGNVVKAGYRNVDAYAIGQLKGTGNLAILGFYRSGVTKSDNFPYWRTYLVKNIKALSVTNNRFKVRSSYKKFPKQFASIDFQL